MRKYYIDNLRWICILLLFPYHTCMIYNNWGENFYVKSTGIPLLSGFIGITSPWYMPLLFVIAGMSTSYALQRRTSGQYIKERFLKLFVPLISGVVLFVPIQTYFAEKFHNGYTGGYFHQFIMFFTTKKDLTGYTGGFTPAHLWFILYLFVISLIALPFILLYKKSGKKLPVEKLSVLSILPMFLIFTAMSLILNLAGKSLGEFFALFMLGYLILSADAVQNKLEKSRWYLFGGLIILTVLNEIFMNVWNYPSGKLYGIFTFFISWVGILALLGMGKHYLNFHNKFSDYFSKASFPVYIFHQSFVILAGYYMLKATSSIALQVIVIITVSFILTMVTYEIFKRIPLTRFLFGIKR